MLSYIIAVGAVVGALDCLFGNRLHLGEKFEEGFLCLGATALNMAGIICLAPVIGNVIQPAVVPAFRLIGADPAMAGSLFANNMGGYPLAVSLADNPYVGLFSGLIVSSMLGATIVYTIPVGLGLIQEHNREPFSKGIMIGVMTIPVGAFVGGIMMGLPIKLLLVNSIPILLAAFGLVIGFLFYPKQLLKGFLVFAKGIKSVTIVGLGAAAVTQMTGIVLIPGMSDLQSAMDVVVSMGILQLGSLPMAAIFMYIFQKPLSALGKRMGINATSVAALPIACVNVISVFTMIKNMDTRGIVVSSAWFTSAICVFTAHLAYTEAMEPALVVPVVTAKLVSGSLAVLLALAMTKKEKLLQKSSFIA